MAKTIFNKKNLLRKKNLAANHENHKYVVQVDRMYGSGRFLPRL